MRKAISVFIIFVVFAITSASYAATYHVRKDGHDTNCNGSADAAVASAPNCAYLTIQKGVNRATTAGDTVTVHNGDYFSQGTVSSAANGTSGAGIITLQCHVGETCTISKYRDLHNYNRVQGFSITGSSGYYIPGVDIQGNYLEIINNTFIGTGGLAYAIGSGLAKGGSNAVIRGNVFDGLSNAGNRFFIVMNITGDSYTISNNVIKNIVNTERIWNLAGTGSTISNNEVYGLTWVNDPGVHPDIFQTVEGDKSKDHIISGNYFHDSNVQMALIGSDPPGDVDNWIWRNNIFANIEQSFFSTGTNFKFYNNTFYNVGSNENHPILLYKGVENTWCTNFIFRNNILIGNATSNALGWWGTGSGSLGGEVFDYNFISKPDFSARTGFAISTNVNGGDPKFVAAYTNCVTNTCDFRLQNGSPLINAGANLSASWTGATDKNGLPRPYGAGWDIGAYEYNNPEPPRNLPEPPRNLRIK